MEIALMFQLGGAALSLSGLISLTIIGLTGGNDWYAEAKPLMKFTVASTMIVLLATAYLGGQNDPVYPNNTWDLSQ